MRSIKLIIALAVLFLSITSLWAQTESNPRPMTMAEYQKAMSFSISNMDADSYVKFENAYILDRYEMRKPYFITGDDGQKKRIDLYKVIAKEGMQELGLMIFYTTEKGKVYKAVQPNFTSSGEVWKVYFEEIHAIDKEEKNFVLKLSYVLSKEVSFQLYKAINAGKDISKESATYGNDICFPGDQQITMANGKRKRISDIMPGDKVLTVDPTTGKEVKEQITKLTMHEAKNYAIVQIILAGAITADGVAHLSTQYIEATPNHPIQTKKGKVKIGQLIEGDEIIAFNRTTKSYQTFSVLGKKQFAGGSQRVYNFETAAGSTMVVNDIPVWQK